MRQRDSQRAERRRLRRTFSPSTPAIVYNESGKAPAWHDEDIVTGFEAQGGVVKVPEGPGLGVEVNEEAVNKFRLDL